MKPWTHRVACREFAADYGPSYAVFATLCEDGKFKLAERGFQGRGLKYGMVLTDVRIIEARKEWRKRFPKEGP